MHLFCMSISDRQPLQIHIYELDHALLKTPVPNPVLYTPESVDYLLSDPFYEMFSWYRSVGILEKAVKPSGVHRQDGYSAWNETLVKMVRDDMKNPDCIPVLYCIRYDSAPMADVIRCLVEQKRLKFWKVELDVSGKAWEFAQKLVDEFPNCYELSYYCAETFSSARQSDLGKFMEREHPEIDFFWQRCPFESCVLSPLTELGNVSSTNRSYNRSHLGKEAILRRVDRGLIYGLSLEEQRRLAEVVFADEGFLSNDDRNLIFCFPILIPICNGLRAQSVWTQYENPNDIRLTAAWYGFVQGSIYAVMFTYDGKDISHAYGDSPIAVIAHAKGCLPSSWPKLISTIKVWRRLHNTTVEERTVHASVQYDRRFGIYPQK